jgi:hypothetical protein
MAQAIVGNSFGFNSGQSAHLRPSSTERKLIKSSPLLGTIVPFYWGNFNVFGKIHTNMCILLDPFVNIWRPNIRRNWSHSQINETEEKKE